MEAPKEPRPEINPYDGKSMFLFDSSEEHDEYKKEYERQMKKYKEDLTKYYEYKANEKAEKHLFDMFNNISIAKTPTGEEELSDMFNNVTINEHPKIIPTHGVWHNAHLNILKIIKAKEDYNYLTQMAKKLLNAIINKKNSNDNIILHDGKDLWRFYLSKTVEHKNEDMMNYLKEPSFREAVQKARTKHVRTKKGGSKRNKIRRKRTLRGGKDRGSPTKNPTSRASISREFLMN